MDSGSSDTRRRGWLAAFVVFVLIGLPVGYALGQQDEPSDDQLAPQPPTSYTPPSPGEVDYFAEGATPERVSGCLKDVESMGDPLVCEMILAISDGRLEPGEHTRSELEEQQAIRASGE